MSRIVQTILTTVIKKLLGAFLKATASIANTFEQARLLLQLNQIYFWQKNEWHFKIRIEITI